jgi:hypothetical protein
MTCPRIRRLALGGVDHTAPPRPGGHASTGSRATNYAPPQRITTAAARQEPTEGTQP